MENKHQLKQRLTEIINSYSYNLRIEIDRLNNLKQSNFDFYTTDDLKYTIKEYENKNKLIDYQQLTEGYY